jgi:hypothetical protein
MFVIRKAAVIDLITQLKFLLLNFASAAWGGCELCCLCLRTSCPCDSSWSAKHNRQVNLPNQNHSFLSIVFDSSVLDIPTNFLNNGQFGVGALCAEGAP